MDLDIVLKNNDLSRQLEGNVLRIATVETLKKEGEAVTIYSDSKYVVDAVEKGWVFGWEKKYFHGKMQLMCHVKIYIT